MGTAAPVPVSTQTTQPPATQRRWIFAVGVSSVAVAALLLITYLNSRISTDDAQVDSHIVAIAPKVSGYIESVRFTDNQQVGAGDELIRIDPRDYQAHVAQAKAALDLAEAQAASDKIKVNLTQDISSRDISSARAQQEADSAEVNRSTITVEQANTAIVRQAQANLDARTATRDRAQADLQRYTTLLATDDVSQFQFDQVQAAARVAAGEYEVAQQQLSAAKQAVDIARASAANAGARLTRSVAQLDESKARQKEVPIAEAAYRSSLANVEAARAALQAAELQLSYCSIAAPVAGQITQRQVEIGQYVSPGQLLFTVVPLNAVYVTANFKETQLANVRPGQRAKIVVDTYGKTFQGTVDSIGGATGSRQALLPPQNATGNFVKVVQRIPVKIRVDQGSGSTLVLRPGMNVEARIFTH